MLKKLPKTGFGATFDNTSFGDGVESDDPRAKRAKAVAGKSAEKIRAALAKRVFGKKC